MIKLKGDGLMEPLRLLGKISFKDNGEKLTDLRKMLGGKARFAKRGRYLLRQTAAEKLLEAVSFLPKGYRFQINLAFRTREEQEDAWEKIYEALRRKHRKLPKNKVVQMANKITLPVNGSIAPFLMTGGALAAALVSPAGREVEMTNRKVKGRKREAGSRIEAKEWATDYPGLHRAIKKNRQILVKALTKAGFVNYPKEWWHWSYGDHLWALLKNKPYAIYGPVESTDKRETDQLKLI